MTRYAISDLHGHLDIFKKIKKRLMPEDILYVLGDCNDRGPESWETLKTVLEDSQSILLLGNHELMLMDLMSTYFNFKKQGREEDVIFSRDYDLLCMNGGQSTYYDWLDEDNLVYWYRRLRVLPTEETIYQKDGRKIILTHAGYTPWKKPKKIEDLVWNRKHFFDKWLEEDSSIIIHGHTINEYLYDELVSFGSFYNKYYFAEDFEDLAPDLKKLVYADGHKICIDPGTVLTKKGILLNLETLEQEVIE